jgi:hypothetical protein
MIELPIVAGHLAWSRSAKGSSLARPLFRAKSNSFRSDDKTFELLLTSMVGLSQARCTIGSAAAGAPIASVPSLLEDY